MKKNRDLILKSAGISMIGLIISRLISYFNTIIIARLGSAQYGLLTLALAITSFVTVISLLGINQGLLRYLSYYLGKKDKSHIKGTFISSLKFSSTSSIFAMILILIFAKDIAIYFFNKPELIRILQISAFIIPFAVLTELFVSVMLSLKKVSYQVGIREIGERLLRLILSIIFIWIGLGIAWIAVAYLIAAISVCLILFFISIKFTYFRDNKIKSNYNLNEILKYSMPLVITGFLSLLIKWADTFILGYFKSASEVGIYNITFSTSTLLGLIPTALMSLFLPIISNLYGKKNMIEINRISKVIQKWIFTANFPFFIILLFFSNQLLNIVFGKEYAIGYISLIILAMAYIFVSLTHIYTNNLLLFKKTKLLSFIVLISTSVNIILNLILVPNYGINGAAFSTLISSLALFILLIIYNKNRIKKVFNFSYLKPIIAGLISGFIINIISKILNIKISFINYIIILPLILLLIYFVLLAYVFKDFNEYDKEAMENFKKIIYKKFRG